jgi:RNA polymerase sigma-70 factor (ECF subfamily)
VSRTPRGETSETIPKEQELLSRARQGDVKAFDRLLRKYQPLVYNYAFRVCRDPEKAKETLQDTLLNVYRKLDQFDGRSKLSTWIYSIVTNNCLMSRRRTKASEHVISLELLTPRLESTAVELSHLTRRSRSPLDQMLVQERREVMNKAILKLPLKYRLAFVLSELEGLTAAETARVLKISVEAAKSRLRRARASLRKELEAYL